MFMFMFFVLVLFVVTRKNRRLGQSFSTCCGGFSTELETLVGQSTRRKSSRKRYAGNMKIPNLRTINKM